MSNCTQAEGDEQGGVSLLSILTLLILVFISLGIGCTLTIENFKTVWRTKKRAFLVGVFCQFVLMPLMSFAFAHLFGFEPLVAVGVILLGSAPGGATSNVFTYWAKGNVALSIAMSSVSITCALFMLPLNFALYVQTGFAKEAGLVLPFLNVFMSLLAITLPTILGVYIRRADFQLCTSWTKPVAAHRLLEHLASVVAAIFLIAALIVGLLEDPQLFDPITYPKEWGLACFFQPLGCAIGFVLARTAKLDGPDSRAVALETGVQNNALVLALVSLSFSGCQRVLINRFVLIATFWYVVSSAWVVSLLRFFQPGGQAADHPPASSDTQAEAHQCPVEPTSDVALHEC